MAEAFAFSNCKKMRRPLKNIRKPIIFLAPLRAQNQRNVE